MGEKTESKSAKIVKCKTLRVIKYGTYKGLEEKDNTSLTFFVIFCKKHTN